MTNTHLGGVMVVLMSTAMPVWAQTAPVAAEPAQASTEDQAGLGDILVMAQRRSELQQNVPISVTVQSGLQLQAAGVNNLRDLGLVTPGLTFQAQGSFVQPSLRGVTTTITGPGSDNPIALYLDGVYLGTQAGASIDLPDVERVEVSKGPQGTLFGRNATGGAIQIFTRAPSFTPTGSFEATAGYYTGAGTSRTSPDLGFKGFVSGPIASDAIAASLSFSYRNVEGYSRNIAYAQVSPAIQESFGNDRADALRSYSFRGKLLIKPADGVSVLLTGFYMNRFTTTGPTSTAIGGLTAGAYYPGAIFGTKPWQVAYDAGPPLSRIRNYGGSAKIDVDTSIGTITSTTSYTLSRYREQVDVDASYSPQCLVNTPMTGACLAFIDTQPNNEFLQDFLFSSNKFGILKFVAGGNYYSSNGAIPGTINDFRNGAVPGVPSLVYDPIFIGESRVRTRAIGMFAQADWSLTDALTLTTGIRYSYEKKKGYFSIFSGPFNNYSNPSWDSFTPRLGLRYAIDSRSNVYATYSKGFKSGVLPILAEGKPVNPENITAYEIGYKAARSGYTINAAAFYYDYKNIQIQQFINGTIIPSNAASARIFGLEFDGTIALARELSVRAGATWLPTARFVDYSGASGNNSIIGFYGLGSVTQDASGTRLLRAPKLTAVLSLNYEADLDGGKLTIAPALNYSSRYLPYDTFKLLVQKAYVKAGLDVSYRPASSNFRFSVWGHNLNNAKVFSQTTISNGAARASYAEPQELGITVGYAF